MIPVNEIFKVYLSLSLSGSLLMLVLKVLRPLYKERFSMQWQYYIWLVVIIRMLLPWNPGNGIVGRLFQNGQIERLWENIASDPEKSGKLPLNGGAAEQTVGSEKVQAEQKIQEIQNQEDQKENKEDGQMIYIIWLSAAFILLIRKVTVYQCFVKYIKAGCRAVDDIDRMEVLGKAAAEKHITCTAGLYTNSLAASPLLSGIIHPSIILTDAELTDTDFYYTVMHELTHLKRKDLVYKWLVQLTVCLHWFNPLVYLMERDISRLCELSCDEAVMQNLEEKERRAYGDTLLRAMGAGGSYKNSMASVTLNESKKLLKERLGAIMCYRKKSKLAAVLSAAAVLLLTACAAVMGMYVQPQAAEKAADRSLLSDCKITEEDGCFYIICKDVSEQDIPSGSVTEGCISVMLVKEDGYASLGPFENAGKIVRDASELIDEMLQKNQLTNQDACLLAEAAEKIQEKILKVKMCRSSVTLEEGETIFLKLTGTKKQPVWSSENKKAASVSKNGKVTAKKAGQTTITAKLYGQTYKCIVKIENKAKKTDETKNEREKDTDEKGSDGAGQNAEKKIVKEQQLLQEYQSLGITKQNGVYFYNGKRVRIFLDLRSDQSFVTFHYDVKGTVDLKIKRTENFTASGVAYLSEKEAKEILEDMKEDTEKDTEKDAEKDMEKNKKGDVQTKTQPDEKNRRELSVSRMDMDELPQNVLQIIKGCEDRQWYVIKDQGIQYVYYHGLKQDYAFKTEINGKKASVIILDMGGSAGQYVLLAVKSVEMFAIQYNGRNIGKINIQK